MPPLNNMGDKDSQISDLRLVRTTSVKEHTSLKEEEKRIHCLFPQMNQQRQYQGGNLHQYEGYHNTDHGSIYYNIQFVAESTLQQYGGGGKRGSHAGGGLPTCAGSNGRQ